MPFLRVLRDKRGYETTYLMHWFRDGGRQRSRILYVFRTPPGVRVGRSALDASVVRELEAHYPDIEFEWDTLTENQQVVESPVEPPRPRKRERGAGSPDAAELPADTAVPTEGHREPEFPSTHAAAPSIPVASITRTAIPASIAGKTAEEKIAWLIEWYPRIRERVPGRTHDPVRREALYGLCERLNSSSWTDADQITAGLVTAAEALQRLSRIFAKRRRRARRRATTASRPDVDNSMSAETHPPVGDAPSDGPIGLPPEPSAERE